MRNLVLRMSRMSSVSVVLARFLRDLLCFCKIWTAVQRLTAEGRTQEFFSLSKYDSP